MSSPFNELVTSPISTSPMDDQTSSSTSIDMNSWLPDHSSNLSNNVQLDLQDNCRPVNHIIFVRDVIPYEKDHYSTSIVCDEGKRKSTKGSYVRRVQGVKNNYDERYTSVLPEIKVCFSQLIMAGPVLVCPYIV
jgi:hypothetical protein